MKTEKKTVFAVLLLVVSLTLIGCLGSSTSNLQEARGVALFFIVVPENMIAMQNGYQPHISVIEMTLRQGSVERFQSADAVNEKIEIGFEDLRVGKWDVLVEAKDSEGVAVYSGLSNVQILEGATTRETIELRISNGDLNVRVQIPHSPNVTRGTVLLRDLIGNSITKELTIEGDVGLASFKKLSPNTWPIEVELFDGNDVVAWGYGVVDVLPGRETTAVVELVAGSGELIIEVDWKLPPKAPTDLRAEWANNELTLSWQSSLNVGIAGYVVYRSVSETGPKQLLNDVLIATASYTDSSAVKGSTYWYWVQAISVDELRSILSAPLVVKAGDEVTPNDVFDLTIHKAGWGFVDVTPKLDQYPYGTIVTLKATSTNSSFSHWEGDICRTENPLTIPIHSSIFLRAVFQPLVGRMSDPVVYPLGGIYYEPQAITFSSHTDGVGSSSFRYTLDGTDPTKSHGTWWNSIEPVHIPYSTVLKVIAYYDDMEPSNVITETYKIYYVLEIDIDESKGRIILHPEKEYYEHGDLVVLEARPKPGYYLNHWAGVDGDDVYNYGGEYAIEIVGNTQIEPAFSSFSIQEAINAAEDGDIIVVPPGKYLENIDFLGKSITVRGSDPLDSDVVAATIIDAGGIGPVVKFRNGETHSAKLSGFTLQNGQGATRENYHYGGGIYITNASSPTIENNIIRNNLADYGGGISIHDDSNPIIKDNVVVDNKANSSGDGVHLESSSAVIENNLISNNGRHGVQVKQSSSQIINNTIEGHTVRGIDLQDSSDFISGNQIRKNGTGVYASLRNTSRVEISNNIIEDNFARGIHIYWGAEMIEILNNTIRYNGLQSQGGGIYVERVSGGMTVKISGNIIGDNVGTNGGGIFLAGSQGVVAEVSNNLIENNVALGSGIREGNGGGIFIKGGVSDSSDILIMDNHFEGNAASDGGAVYLIESSKAVFEENVFQYNTAKENGGSIYVSRSAEINSDARTLNFFAGNLPDDQIFHEISAFSVFGGE